VLEEMFGAGAARADVIERYGTFIADFTLKGLAPDTTPPVRPKPKRTRKATKT
jgi:hypothetical protein